MSITPRTSGRSARGRFKHGSNLSENLRSPRVTSQWKSTGYVSGSSPAPPERGFHYGSALDYEELARLLSSHPDYRVLKAIDPEAGVDRLCTLAPGERVAAVVDTETTGLDLSADRIIEVAIQRFTFNAGHRISQIEQPRSWLEDPQRPLPESIAKLTGISDPDLKASGSTTRRSSP